MKDYYCKDCKVWIEPIDNLCPTCEGANIYPLSFVYETGSFGIIGAYDRLSRREHDDSENN